MIALADCNTFFASVERVFHAGLRGKPVCVLSSNDGNIVALTSEAKALGLKRGDPFFRVRGIIEKNRVSVFSGNLMLYEAISKRVKSIMSQTVAHTESYSIDEQFLYLNGYDKHCDPVELMRGMVRKISLYTDIPVSVGIAKTKTLAKVASKFAKHYKGYGGVCMIDTDEKRRKALSLSQLDDIWGIGPKTFARLSGLGITNPLQLADMPGGWVSRNFHKPGYQTWLELNGVPCIETEEIISRQTDIVPGCCQSMLFDSVGNRSGRIELSRTIDKINLKYGLKTVGLAITGDGNSPWKNRKEHLTPNYLTDIDQLMTVNI